VEERAGDGERPEAEATSAQASSSFGCVITPEHQESSAENLNERWVMAANLQREEKKKLLVIYAKIYKQLILRNSDENDDESFEVPMKKGHAKTSADECAV